MTNRWRRRRRHGKEAKFLFDAERHDRKQIEAAQQRQQQQRQPTRQGQQLTAGREHPLALAQRRGQHVMTAAGKI